ncbi:MAG TPA: hypothetical protein VMZ71_06185, partial [Gemmataceae bacterium]|nr:hypothetical protein [Gemmataceae bacterium]
MAVSPVDRVVRSARRRLFAQAVVNRLVAAWAVALAVALAWFLAEPLLLESAVRWTVLASLVVVATLAAVVLTIRRAPSRLDAALELDSRFALRERVTSVLSLPEVLRDSPAGRALLADAEKHATPVRVRDKFALFLPRSAVRVPVFSALLAVVAFVYHPVTDSPAWAESKQKQAETARASASTDGKRPTAKAADRPKVEPERANKSAQVKELEAELDRLDRQARDTNPTAERVREKITEITAAEEKARAAEREAFDKLSRMENTMRQLEKLSGADDFKDGPAKELN